MKKIGNIDPNKASIFGSEDEAKRDLYVTLLKRIQRGESLKANEHKTLKRFRLELFPDSPPEVFTTYKEASEYVGVSTRTISYYVNNGKLPYKNKVFLRADLDEIKKSVNKNMQTAKGATPQQNDQSDEDDNDDIIDPEVNLLKALDRDDMKHAEANRLHQILKARRESLVVQQLEGKLIPVENVKEQFVARAYEFRNALQMLSRKIGHEIASISQTEPKEIIDIINREVKEVLLTYSRPLDTNPDEENILKK